MNVAQTTYAIGRGIAAIRGASPSDTTYIRYAIFDGLSRLLALTSGSVFPNISAGDLKKFELSWPAAAIRTEIAGTLEAIDKKIESNRRAVELIELLLRLEFQRVAASDDVVEVPLSDLVSIAKGVSYKSVDLQPSRTSLVSLKSFDRRGGYKPNGLKPYVGPYKPHQVVEPGEVVVAQTDLTQGAEVVGRAIRVPADARADTLVASLDLVIVRPLRSLSPEYLQGVLTDEAFRQYCQSRTNGTTVLHLAADAIPAYGAPIVSASEQLAYTEFARPLIKRADSLNRETDKLIALRDGLLADLLSGRARVTTAANVAAESII